MSWIEGFDKLSVSTKSVVLSVAGLIPFWIISIYLFNKPLYNKGDYLILGCICFCFSLMLYALNLVTALFMLKVKGGKNETAFYLSGMSAIIGLSVSMLIGYIFQWRFITFVTFEFIYTGLLLLKWVNKDYLKRLNAKKAIKENN